MKMIKKIFYLLLALVVATSCTGKSVTVTVTNKSSIDRDGELVSVYKETVNTKLLNHDDLPLVVLNEAGEQVPYQITNEGAILFPAKVKAKGKAVYTIQPGDPIKVDPCCYGNIYPKRMDDLAWENDRIGWRAYGPAVQKRGDQLFGYDLWSKRVEYPLLDKLYEMDRQLNAKKAELGKEGKKMTREEEQAMSYHVDHGEGCDYYGVGPTLGAGTPAFISPATGEFVYPYAYTTCTVLDNGPLRFSARLTYDLTVNDVRVLETRLISLDKGSQMTKSTVWYTNIFSTIPWTAGIVMHKGSDEVTMNAEEGYAGYVEPEDPTNGTMYLGLVFPGAVDDVRVQPLLEKETAALKAGATGHLIGVVDYNPRDKVTYYFGAGWSKHGFKNSAEWFAYLKDFAAKARTPLEVKVK